MGKLPVLSGREVVKIFEKDGWKRVNQVGSHITMKKKEVRAKLSIPLHREVGRGLLRGLIRDAGLSVEDFIKLLS